MAAPHGDGALGWQGQQQAEHCGSSQRRRWGQGEVTGTQLSSTRDTHQKVISSEQFFGNHRGVPSHKGSCLGSSVQRPWLSVPWRRGACTSSAIAFN